MAVPASADLRGPDVSNNDPVFRCAPIKAAGNAFLFAKAIEGTGFVDSTFPAEAACAKRASLFFGAYDFGHVGSSNPVAEADLFVRVVRAQGGFNQRGMLPPVLDAEYPTAGVVGGRAWITAWVHEVEKLTHRKPLVYTGAWWWNPSVGCFSFGLSVWSAAYTSSPITPCGFARSLFWQYTDNGWNGSTRSDMSIFYGTRAQLEKLALATPVVRHVRPHRPKPTAATLARQARLRELLLTRGCRRRRAKSEPLGHKCLTWFSEGDALAATLRG